MRAFLYALIGLGAWAILWLVVAGVMTLGGRGEAAPSPFTARLIVVTMLWFPTLGAIIGAGGF